MFCLGLFLMEDEGNLRGAYTKYELLERIVKIMNRFDMKLLGFGIGNTEVRLVVEGPDSCVANLIRGIKVGTLRAIRSRGEEISWGSAARWGIDESDLMDAMVWAHRIAMEEEGDLGPLASVWSSHRDLLGYRKASFYKPIVLHGRLSVLELHRRLGGNELPERVEEPVAKSMESLGHLLRVAGATVGVLPADRKCFRLFAHLARSRGWRNIDIAIALSLTSRRIRQLIGQPEPLLPMARTILGDARLCNAL